MHGNPTSPHAVYVCSCGFCRLMSEALWLRNTRMWGPSFGFIVCDLNLLFREPAAVALGFTDHRTAADYVLINFPQRSVFAFVSDFDPRWPHPLDWRREEFHRP